jgi:hypothetical protein
VTRGGGMSLVLMTLAWGGGVPGPDDSGPGTGGFGLWSYLEYKSPRKFCRQTYQGLMQMGCSTLGSSPAVTL